MLDGVADNFQLNALVTAALLERGVRGQSISAEALSIIRGETACTGSVGVRGSYNFYTYQSIGCDLTDPMQIDKALWVWNEGVPTDVPRLGDVRILVLGPPAYERNWTAGRPFSALRASATVESEMTRAELDDALVKPIVAG